MYHPYVLRPVPIVVTLLLLIGVQVVFNMQAAQPRVLGFATDVSIDDVLRFTNQQRQAAGANQLEIDEKLQAAADAKARNMFEEDYWSHATPDGVEPWAFIEETGYSYSHAGENLAKNFRTSSGVVQGWMNSPGHRDNLLNEDYDEIGVAVRNGILEGEETTLVVAMYGQEATTATTASAQSAGSTSAPELARQTASLQPLQANATMTWAMKATMPVLALMSMLYAGQHLVIRRTKHTLAWDHHVHPRPLLQSGVLVGVMVVMFASSYGVVG